MFSLSPRLAFTGVLAFALMGMAFTFSAVPAAADARSGASRPQEAAHKKTGHGVSGEPYLQIAAGGIVRIVIPPIQSRDGIALVEIATQTADGRPLAGFSSDTTSGAALPEAVARAGNNSIVLLSGTFNTVSTIALQTGQTLMGAGSLSVKTKSGRVVGVMTNRAAINGAVPNDVSVSMADNSTLTGLLVANTALDTSLSNASGVWAVAIKGATISNNLIQATGSSVAQAVAISSSSGISVLNNQLAGAGYLPTALEVQDSIGTRVAGNTMSVTGSRWNTHAIRVANAYTRGSFTADSTGNTIAQGHCSFSGTTSGSIGLTGGRCPD